ncbi:MAG: SDR family oxidoreductase [Mycobacterium sp.]
MTELLSGKTVVISGVGTGLGREVALKAHQDGANVVLGARTQENLAHLAAELDESGATVAWAVTDINDAQACQGLINTAVEKFDGVDALVNVAAKEDVFGGIEGADLAQWQAMLSTNVVGTLQLVQSAVPQLKKNGGSVVFIGSQSAFHPQLPQAAYATSKGALQNAMYQLAKELGPHKIRLNMVVPTWMYGPPIQLYIGLVAQQRGIPEAEVLAELTAKFPLGEMPADEDVADAVVFFTSDRSRMVTGQTLFVNAGEFFA